MNPNFWCSTFCPAFSSDVSLGLKSAVGVCSTGFEGIDLGREKSRSINSLEKIQKEIWRRYISEAPRANLKRGTLDSVRSVFRNAGIEPDNIFNLREFGGSKEKSLDSSRELKKDVFNFLSFTGSYGKKTTSSDYQGYPTDSGIPKIKSNFL